MTVAGWEREITAAQAITIVRESLDGVAYARIRYGGEAEDWACANGRPCHDCGCAPASTTC